MSRRYLVERPYMEGDWSISIGFGWLMGDKVPKRFVKLLTREVSQWSAARFRTREHARRVARYLNRKFRRRKKR